MTISVTIEAANAAELHAEMLALLPGAKTAFRNAEAEAAKNQPHPTDNAPTPPAEEPPTAEIVPIAERKKPGRPKKSETVVEATPAAPVETAKAATATVEEARAVLSDIKSKIGMEEARQLNKKHGEQPLNDKTPEQWGAIVAEGKVLLAALEE